MKKTTIILSVLLSLNASLLAQKKISREEYIEEYKDIAILEMKRSGVPASITLAQGILESDAGNSRLAREGNNHFGIKCHKSWSGRKMYHDDDAKDECFRKYRNPIESFRDHSNFIASGQRYASLFKLSPTDYRGWAKGLKRAGYATSKTYDRDLIRIIETYELDKYDSRKGRKQLNLTETKVEWEDVEDFVINLTQREIKEKNRVEYIIVKRNDTFFSLSKELEMMQWEFYKYNDIDRDYDLQGGEILYLQPKRNKASRDHKIHTVQEGESLRDISQMYAVKLKRLLKYNNFSEETALIPGQEIRLRSLKN